MNTQKLIFLFLMLASSANLFSANSLPKGNLQGAWSRTSSSNGAAIQQVLLFSGEFFSWTEYQSADGAFIGTRGGSWKMHGNQLEFFYEFNSMDSTRVGQTETWSWASMDTGLELQNDHVRLDQWKPLDVGQSTDLTGAWLMAGRVRNGETSRRDTNVPRKTMKILTGTRFQWIAYNTETKQFLGTGGGTYSAKDGKYVENLEFFSRDNKRVGLKLEFDFSMQSGEWHHSGKSSAGEPLHEIWTLRAEF